MDTVASLALVAFGGWIAISALLEMRRSAGRGHEHGHLHGHRHSHGFSHLGGAAAGDFHGPKLQRIDTGHGAMELSIFEDGVPPRFRLKGAEARFVVVETTRPGGSRQTFQMANRGACWESVDAIPEPHGFAVTVTVDHGGHAHAYATEFAEHDHGHGRHDHDGGHGHDSQPADDPLHAPLAGGVAVLVRHCHAHRHGDASPHVHLHDHGSSDAHQIALGTDDASPLHTHMHKNSSRTALMLILGSSSMVEGVPAFFAAAKYGVGVILLMAAVFAASTIATYVLLCVYSAAGLRRVRLGAFERYGEALSGGLIALGGAAFWIWAAI